MRTHVMERTIGKPSHSIMTCTPQYPLRGRHITTKCESCHKGSLYKDKTSTDCNACHKKDDKHKGQFTEKCERCHTERDWKVLLFEHDHDTQYPLTGKHRTTKCESCHTGQLYKAKTPTDCNACHKKDDIHKGRFNEQCQRCHTERNWKALLFDHDRDTAYPLLGKHRIALANVATQDNCIRRKHPPPAIAVIREDDPSTTVGYRVPGLPQHTRLETLGL